MSSSLIHYKPAFVGIYLCISSIKEAIINKVTKIGHGEQVHLGSPRVLTVVHLLSWLSPQDNKS